MSARLGSHFLSASMAAAAEGVVLAFQMAALAEGAAPAPCTPTGPAKHVTGSSRLYYDRETATKLAKDDAMTKAQEACGKLTVPAACSDSWLRARVELGAVACSKGFLSGDRFRCTAEADYSCFCTGCRKK